MVFYALQLVDFYGVTINWFGNIFSDVYLNHLELQLDGK
ncbi:hypothetical protein VIB_002737 [Vibrio metschnikovii CIP 69.14]|nr:hypothetical protein VIB_002737 [Vibrio metschnikovii CIP 69.14]